MMKKRHHDLEAWRQAVQLVKGVYSVTATFPKEELYGLTSQMRRAAVSIPSNIAEGAARASRKELIQFLSVARGSLMELETQGIIARELGFMEKSAFESLQLQIERVFALLSGLTSALRKKA